jgi:hypothetical protein
MRPPPPMVPSNNYGTRLLACCGIVIATGLFFSVYDAMERRPILYTPTLAMGHSHTPERSMTEVQARQSDMEMSSATKTPLVAAGPARLVQASGPAKTKLKIAAPPKHQRPRVAAPRIHPDARAAFARSPAFGYAPFGGF